MRTAVIYGIRNLKTGKCYVGSSRELKVRWENHKKLLESNTHTPKLQVAWNKSLPTDWQWAILEKDIPIIHQFESEQHWINSLDSYRNGYNSNPKAGSYVSIDHRGYQTFINERKDEILEMLVQMEQGIPYRQIASTFGVSVGFLSKLKQGNSDLLVSLIENEKVEKQRTESEKKILIQRKKKQQNRNVKIVNLISQGYTYREVASTLGCSLGTVGNIAAKSIITKADK